MKLNVECRGQGPDLVLLHGWSMHGGMWGPWLDGLAGEARLHVVDLPGHGRSPWTAEASELAGLSDAVVPLVPRGATVLGWSLGGMVALELARRNPRHLGALVLVATTPKFLSGPDWEHGLEPAVLDAFTRGLEADWLRTVQGFLALQARGDECPAARLRIIERSGHAPFLSHPDQVLTEVRGLLSRQPQGQVA